MKHTRQGHDRKTIVTQYVFIVFYRQHPRPVPVHQSTVRVVYRRPHLTFYSLIIIIVY